MSTEYGQVKFFNSDRGFGFIRRKPQPDIFFHVSDVIAVDPHKPLARGDKVEFVAIVDHKKNKWKASRVKKTNKPFTAVPAVKPNPHKSTSWRVWSGHEKSFYKNLNEWKQKLDKQQNTMLDFEVSEIFADAKTLSKLLKALVDTIGIYLNSFKIGFAYGCYSYPGSYVSRNDWCYIFSKCPNLKHIRLIEAHTVNKSVLDSISRYCPNVTQLEIEGNRPKHKQVCEQCCGEVTKCKDHWIYVDFHRPDGGVETKSIGWCVDNDFEEVSPGVWSGPWYHKDTKHSNYCYDNDTKEESESEDDEWDVVDMSENIGYNGMPKYMEDELLCQGIKPWDDCAMSALSVLFD
eukprot:241111_1